MEKQTKSRPLKLVFLIWKGDNKQTYKRNFMPDGDNWQHRSWALAKGQSNNEIYDADFEAQSVISDPWRNWRLKVFR